EGEERRLLLWERIGSMRELLPSDGSNKKGSTANSAIFPWVVGEQQEALNRSAERQSEVLLVPAIGYPTVAKGSARLRITVTASHQEDQIRSLCQAIKRLSTAS